jgi:CheY-like chemotaxis protein
MISGGEERRVEVFACQREHLRQKPESLDLVMPGLDGIEIMRLLAERKCRAKIVISSGMGTRVLDAAQRSAQEHGLSIAGVISKPISREALRSLIGKESEPDQPLSAANETESGSEFEITRQDLQSALDRTNLHWHISPLLSGLT